MAQLKNGGGGVNLSSIAHNDKNSNSKTFCISSSQNSHQTNILLHHILNVKNLCANNSPLFQSLDSLKDMLFATNSCPFLPNLYAIYKDMESIDFSYLPQSFVLKTNHDCGGVIVVPDKMQLLNNAGLFYQSLHKLKTHLQTNYYDLTKEWHYKDIEPIIFAEEMLEDNIQDFRFHCFGGKTAFIQVANATHTHNDLFDREWNRIDVSYVNTPSPTPPQKPIMLDSMLHIAHTLSQPFNYVRLDLYILESQIFVGELTFTPNGGIGKFGKEEYDKKFGALWQL